jgi:hypothetical protein
MRHSGMLARTLAALLLVAACSGPQSPTPPPPGGPGPGTEPAPGPGPGAPPPPGPSSSAPKLGEPCGPGDACGEGSCVTYYGIAGPRGPAFKSCEIRCDAQGKCAGDRKCITVADGPGQVCR